MLPLFALACWALLIRHLSPEWTVNEQYHFGWLVPFLAAYLIKVRGENPPPARPPQRRLLADLVLLALAGASVLLMPIREANLDWRLIEWGLVAIAIAASLLCAWHLGGWPWVRHFAFPLLFFLIAVPLPRTLEYPWMDRLMLNNATTSAELLRWLGVEATARGNLIDLPNCRLGVEEACSGIRSLQSTLMLSLFLGEILALSWVRRTILLAAGLGWAVVTNIGRTSALGWIASREGQSAVDRWHDVAGYSVLALCALTVGLSAWLLARYSSREANLHPHPSAFQPSASAARFRSTTALAAFGLAAIVAGFAANQLWFDYQERKLSKVTEWDFRAPSEQSHYREIPIPPLTRKLLHFDEGYNALWKDPSGHQWQSFFFHWYAGRNAGQTALPHDPRSCLGAIGMELVTVLPSVTFARQDVELTFDAFHFRDHGRDLYVFNCLAEDVRTSAGPRQVLYVNSPSARVSAALAGRRQAGQRRLEVVLWDSPNAQTAVEQFSALLDRQVRIASRALH
jgi:exosortase